MRIRSDWTVVLLLALCQFSSARGPATSSTPAGHGITTKTESFDRDPGWVGVNNRSARLREPRRVRQDFGFSPGTRNCGGDSPGEIGGLISPAAEAAYYGKPIEVAGLSQPLKASGRMAVGRG